MHATLDSFSLKPFTRVLTCLSKYGDDLCIQAFPDGLVLSTTNSSMSAHGRVKLRTGFFSRYKVNSQTVTTSQGLQLQQASSGQLLTKNLLSVFKGRALDKSVDKCELVIAQGEELEEEDDEDRLSSKLIIRLHCKHGVVKTHRLVLMMPTTFMEPEVPNNPNESRLSLGPGAAQSITNHFPMRSNKNDHQLVWQFEEKEITLRCLESAIDSRGRAQLSTELTISHNEFSVYDLHSWPVIIGWHMKEFNAAIAYAEAMSLDLEIRFTEPSAPLYIDADTDDTETLFVIATTTPQGADAAPGTASNQARQRAKAASAAASSHPPSSAPSTARKRTREPEANGNGATPSAKTRRPMKVVQRVVDMSDVEQGRHQESRSVSRVSDSQPSNSLPPFDPFGPEPDMGEYHFEMKQEEDMLPPPVPLFYPSSQQLTQAERESLSALGDVMDTDELNAILEGEGEEVGGEDDDHWFEKMDDDEASVLEATQPHDKGFKPLFDD